MNKYEEKLAARKARLEERAEKASAASAVVYRRARSMGECIPFGQPILVGHHSESRDRNFRSRIHNTYGKAFALQDKASYYADKAASVGTGGISSDDPDAIKKLRAELEEIEASQARMKAVNKAIRSKKTPELQIAALVAEGFTADQAKDLVKPDFAGRIGFPAYALSNNSANGRRIKARIAELERRNQRADKEIKGHIYTYREDVAENRVMFIFSGKPAEEIRTLLKRYAFKWSPSREAWVRQLNNAGLWAAESIRAELDKAEPSL